ncbi:MAG: DUF1223 domain-containing protein [Ectothiorhodospiraceae bacterium]|nr:DUF1223 domain-containing protein [Chromatiales bacterium]MCP5154233.1 DUF1223 domain-containing protein [Ectothiorhodospiraceae bacterium]
MSRRSTVVPSLALGFLLGLVVPAVAGAADAVKRFESGPERVLLLELFTSEGCSSCPPADRWISELVDHPALWRRVVPVAFHVDYWDYIGWPDRFAAAANSDRQRAHRANGATGGVYTPGFVVGGAEWRAWFRGGRLDLSDTRAAGQLTVRVDGDRFEATFEPTDAPRGGLDVEVAVLGFGLETEVRAGENEGRRLRHDFVTLGRERHRLAGDANPLRASGRLPEAIGAGPDTRLALAAWVSPRGKPYPLQATGGWLP